VNEKNRTVDWNDRNTNYSQDKLVYYKGDGTVVNAKIVNLVKEILRSFSARQGADRTKYYTDLVNNLNKSNKALLGAETLTGKVIRMLKAQLTVGV
jgi:hypothetical protein